MTTDELRATAERLVAAYDLTRSMLGGPRRSGVMDAAVSVVLAWLAEHPEDGTELLTADWLRSVGFTDDPTDTAFLRIPLPGSLYPAYLCVCSDPNSKTDGGNAMFTSYDRRKDGSDDPDTEDMVVTGKDVIRTRGDVRRLLRALSVTTTEAAP